MKKRFLNNISLVLIMAFIVTFIVSSKFYTVNAALTSANFIDDFLTGTQGENGWYYVYGTGYTDLNSWQQLQYIPQANAWDTAGAVPYLGVHSNGMVVPGATANVALKWVSDIDGTVNINVNALVAPEFISGFNNANGLTVFIYKNNEKIGEIMMDKALMNIDGTTQLPQTFAGEDIEVSVNDSLYIMLDARDGNNAYDGILMDVAIDKFEGNSPIHNEPKPKINVFLFAGQSNMVGFGLHSELPNNLLNLNTNVLAYAGGELGIPSNGGKWTKLHDQLGKNFGPEFLFGLDMEKTYPNNKFALIKWSVGATNLANDWNPTKTNGLYQHFRNAVITQMSVLSEDYDPVIVGMLWMQGESDAQLAGSADAYEQNLRNFLSRVKNDLNCAELKIVLGRISSSTAWTFRNKVRSAQEKIADEDENIALIDTDDLPRWDLYHYNTEGQITLGSRFATAMTGLINKIDAFDIPAITSVTGNPAAWQTGDVILTVNAQDAASGIKEYSFDDGATWQTGNTKTFTANTSSIKIRAKNNLDNISAATVVEITKIEKTVPTITVTGNSTEKVKSEVLTIKTSYSLSGKTITVSKDGGASEIIDGTAYTITANGSYLFTITNGAGVSATSVIVVTNISEDTTTPTKGENSISEDTTNPTTGDNIIKDLILLMSLFSGIVLTIFAKKKPEKISQVLY